MANPLLCAVRDKEVDEACIDEKVRNILRFMLRVKLIDVDLGENKCSITVNAGRKTGSYNTPEHRQAVLEAARLQEEALLLARQYEHIIFVGGLNHDFDVEGQDDAGASLRTGRADCKAACN